MRRYKSERGGAGVGAVIAILVVLLVAYEAKQFGPHVIAQFQFQDAVVEAAKFSRGKTAEAVQQEVLAKATELGLPVSRDMIKVTRQPHPGDLPARGRVVTRQALQVDGGAERGERPVLGPPLGNPSRNAGNPGKRKEIPC